MGTLITINHCDNKDTEDIEEKIISKYTIIFYFLFFLKKKKDKRRVATLSTLSFETFGIHF